MGRKKDDDSGGGSALRSGGFNKEVTKTFVGRIENLQKEIDGIMATAKDDCAPLRESIAEIKKEAHDAGLPRREFNAELQKRRLLGKIEGIRAGLSEEQRDNFDKLDLFLGDLDETPLGLAAGRKGLAEREESALAH